MASAEREPFTLEELADQAGTYFNPHSEVVIVVDDSVSIDPELFDLGDGEGEWVRISDDVPLDEQKRDELFEEYETSNRPGEVEDDFEEVDDLDPDPLDDDDED